MSGRPKRKATTDTEVRAKRARGETDLGHGLSWKNEGTPIKGLCPLLTLNSDTLPGASKIASFDIDFTIIKTASGRTFAIGKYRCYYLLTMHIDLHFTCQIECVAQYSGSTSYFYYFSIHELIIY